ncbi:hypothetical protein PMA3_26735 [Pseudomonas silesiensis]|uniref:DUF3987 domain-containing protein n=1 Tax=Pseudomonas silesiensis TaxID=1853130 RepID=A0A191Z0Q0_9PSED|nr:YfjI family protein [Pseudomonas silesiensis]ANJ58558.1 hypothetical protein PMA3_26735 [Pseudomonas silesiensis]
MTSYYGLKRDLPPCGSPFPRCAPLPLLGAAINEAQNNIQAPLPLIFFSALTAISVSLQGLFDVRKPNGQCVPVSLMLLTIANSGERKSTAESIFLAPVREVQEEYGVVYQTMINEWVTKCKIWEAKNKAILRLIGKLVLNGRCTQESERILYEHGNSRPAKPKQFKILYDDSTPEALFLGLHQNLPTAGLISSEGGGVLNGRALNDLPKQNSIWSGDSITVDRRTTESYELNEARLTVSIMAQESAFKDYIKRLGEKTRGSGLWARFLVCYPLSTQGSRLIKNGTTSWEHCTVFSERLKIIIRQNATLLDSIDSPKRQTVQFSPEASERWLDIFNAIESGINKDGRFEGFGDHASKLVDNISRVAALFHLFEGFDGDVSLQTLEFAVELCLWCSDEFKRIFAIPMQEEIDAVQLNIWLDRYRSKGFDYVFKNEVLQRGPNKLREKERLDRALSVLRNQGKIDFSRSGRARHIELNGPRARSW